MTELAPNHASVVITVRREDGSLNETTFHDIDMTRPDHFGTVDLEHVWDESERGICAPPVLLHTVVGFTLKGKLVENENHVTMTMRTLEPAT